MQKKLKPVELFLAASLATGLVACGPSEAPEVDETVVEPETTEEVVVPETEAAEEGDEGGEGGEG